MKQLPHLTCARYAAVFASPRSSLQLRPRPQGVPTCDDRIAIDNPASRSRLLPPCAMIMTTI